MNEASSELSPTPGSSRSEIQNLAEELVFFSEEIPSTSAETLFAQAA